MSMVGFIKEREEIKEYLPQSEQLISLSEKRILFFNLYNYYVEKEMRIAKKEMLNGENIYEIFRNKIASLPMNSTLKKRLSNLIDGSNKNLLFDLDDMFLHLVYERIKLVNKGKKIYLYDKTIVINSNEKGVSPILVIPSYTKVNLANIYSDKIINHHLNTVVKTLNETQIRNIYMVYPKHEKFKKHIEIKLMEKIALADEEYRVKVIPYSFSFCTRTVKKCCSTNKKIKGQNNGNRNYLRK